MKLTVWAWMIVSVVVAGVAFAGVALASTAGGGSNIASAPTVGSGQQEFGNTSDGCYENCNAADFWKLALISGDSVTIDWESQTDNEGDDWATTLYVWPAGTTDFSINNVDAYQDFDIGSNSKAESTFSANATGSFPIMFWSEGPDGGPYDFTVKIRHRAVLLFRSPSSISSGTIVAVAAHYPDGTPINGTDLAIQIYGRWNKAEHLLGSAQPANGVAHIRLQVPKREHGLTIPILAYASAGDFLAVHTQSHLVHAH